jgi:hypothetical protein
MGGISNINWGDEICIRFWLENLKRRIQLEDLDEDGSLENRIGRR